MRSILIAGVVAVGACVSFAFQEAKHGPIKWQTDFAAASKLAAKNKKIMMVDFYADWCGPCKKMLASTYQDKTVVARSNEFIPVLIDTDKNQELARKFKITAIPTVIFMTADGSVVKQNTGFMDAKDFLKMMDAASKAR